MPNDPAVVRAIKHWLRDIRTFSRLILEKPLRAYQLRPDGILAGHDYSFRHPELCAAVDAFAVARGLVVRRGPRDIYWLSPAKTPANEGH